MKSNQTWIIIAFTISGSLGLIYEVIWQRKLALIFGTTLPAVTVVLAAFMGGLALGSFVFGRIADRSSNPLKLYGYLELGVGLYCLVMPFGFHLIDRIHYMAFNTFGDHILIEILRFLLAALLLTIPCSFMGGTLPVLSKKIITSQQHLGKNLAYLYFLNTLGAVVGTLLAGFWLIRVFGMQMTTYLAVLGNVIIGILFIALSRSTVACDPSPEPTQTPVIRNRLPYIYGFMGAAAIGCEVAWTRGLNLVIGSTVYAFSMMLAAFLLGLSLGSLVISRRVDRFKSPLQIIGALSILASIAIAISIATLNRLPVILVSLFPYFHQHFLVWQACLFFLGLLVILPPTFFMGALFPVVCKAYITQMKSLGGNVGNLYLWNTFGGIAGSLVTGFLLIPFLGTRTSLIIFGVTFLVIGTAFLNRFGENPKIRYQSLLLGMLCALIFFVIPPWNTLLLDSGVYVYAPQLTEGFEGDRKILFEDEGFHSFVTVSEKAGIRSLRINGKTDGSDKGDLPTQMLLAHLPLLFAEDPQNVLIIGLGTGVTMGSAIKHPVSRVDCIEIDESVIEASRFFDHVSGKPLDSEKSRVIAADARTILSTSPDSYDVVISEPSNPWITGVSNLFTLEHFTSCQRTLTDKGIMCQWIHSYYMDKEILLAILRTFAEVFPYCSLWEGSEGDYLILGSRFSLAGSHEVLRKNLLNPTVSKDLARINITGADDILSRKLLGNKAYHNLVSAGTQNLNTDDHPFVEFHAPESLYHNTSENNYQYLKSFAE